jgi:hypothetical protein
MTWSCVSKQHRDQSQQAKEKSKQRSEQRELKKKTTYNHSPLFD